MKMKKNKLKFWFPLIGGFWFLDFVTKFWAENVLSQTPQIKVLGSWLTFHLVYNTGGVFGILPGNALLFHIVTGIALLFLLAYFVRAQEGSLFNFSMSLVLGGAFGNFTDRFFRHGVVDFIDMGIGMYRWPTYNVADIFILLGAFLMVFYFFKNPNQITN